MQLLISCPHCNTSYRIDEYQLADSDGQARCYHCETVFDARQNASPIPTEETTPSSLGDSDLEDILNSDEISSLFSHSQESSLIHGPEDIETVSDTSLLPSELLDVEADNAPPLEPLDTRAFAKPVEKSSALAFGGWSLGILLLVAVLVAQSSWLQRERLMLNEQGRQILQSLCNTLPCQLPARRDPAAFKVLERTVRSHPSVDGILNINLVFVNSADFSQVAPGIALSLYDTRQQLVARRSFLYREYMDHYSRKAPLFESGKAHQVSFNLEDPGPQVTGFEFSFF